MAKAPWLDRVFAKLLTWQGLPPDGATPLDLTLRQLEAPRRASGPPPARDDGSTYWVYTTEFDRVVRYDDLASDVTMDALDQAPRASATDIAVSVLIDHSGSVHQRNQPLTAAIIESVIAHLHDVSSAVEILGFTTGEWKGGQARAKWLASGQPSYPGRLNGLLHIIYRSHEDRPEIGTAAQVIATLSRAELCKENIDGEAVAWAAQRLMLRQESTRLLILLSDGQPMDDATQHHNGEDFLADHLRQVFRRIDEQQAIVFATISTSLEPTVAGRHALVVTGGDAVRKQVATFLLPLLARGPA
jgi:cobaltochelatase CobT